MMATGKKKKVSFEEGMRALEEMSGRIARGEMPLEETIRLYEEGVALCEALQQQLDEQKKRIEQIDPDTAEIKPFEEIEHGV